jgi:hypothetical protein
MIVCMKLLNHRLEYVRVGRGSRIHARWNGMSSSTPTIDLSTLTMCRRDVPDGVQPLSDRSVNVQKLCQNCYQALNTYGFTQVALVSEKDEGKGVVA